MALVDRADHVIVIYSMCLDMSSIVSDYCHF